MAVDKVLRNVVCQRATCVNTFQPKPAINKRFCSPACKQAAYRDRKEANVKNS